MTRLSKGCYEWLPSLQDMVLGIGKCIVWVEGWSLRGITTGNFGLYSRKGIIVIQFNHIAVIDLWGI